jgi:hypothetical protein
MHTWKTLFVVSHMRTFQLAIAKGTLNLNPVRHRA